MNIAHNKYFLRALGFNASLRTALDRSALFGTSLLLVASFVPAMAVLTSQASDFAPTIARGAPAANIEQGRYVRLGWNKSAVITLPGNARDVLIGNPEILDAVIKTKNVAYLFAKSVGQTNIFFLDADGKQILNLNVEVTLDMTALQKLLQRAIPGTQITVDTIEKNVILGGSAKTVAEASLAETLANKFTASGGGGDGKVVNAIQMDGKDQVMLKVRVVEIRRDVLKSFGIDLTATLASGNWAFPLSSLASFSAGSGLTPASYGGGYKSSSGKTSINSTVKAMERDGLLRILAEPTLSAISGENASFMAGGEYPVPTDYDPVARRASYSFKKYGVLLNFTPMVLSQGRISLRIATEVSEVDSGNSANAGGGVSIPGFSVRRAETTVEMPSGGSMMMAGLIKDSVRQSVDGTPGLKNIPILGMLFRSRDYVRNQTELVVLVTAYLVDPRHESQFATPADRYNVPSDGQSILFGRLNKVYGVNGDNPAGTYNGKVGYVVK